MAKRKERDSAVAMRLEGKSYSEIKRIVQVSKSTLSRWLKDMPLPEERVRSLRDWSEKRIERCRNTKAEKRRVEFEHSLKSVETNIGPLSERELLLAGTFLYWGEGGKTKPYAVSLSNTDPSIISCFISWVILLGAERQKFRVRLHLYSDMKPEQEIDWWSNELRLPKAQFARSYIKRSSRTHITYVQRFTHGTCNVTYGGREVALQVYALIHYFQAMFADTSHL